MLTLRVLGQNSTVDFEPRRLVIAGYTARNQSHVMSHIRELALLGVATPEQVPSFYAVPVGLLTTEHEIVADWQRSSGEVEPVIFFTEGGPLVGVGSDHTDRELEATSIQMAKEACPKVVGVHVIPLSDIERTEDQLDLWSQLEAAPYQCAPFTHLMRPRDVIEAYKSRGGQCEGGLVMFLGTVPTIDGRLAFGRRFRGSLVNRTTQTALQVNYVLLKPGSSNLLPKQDAEPL